MASPPPPPPPGRRPERFTDFVRDYTQSLGSREMRQLFDKEAAEVFAVLTRDQKEPEPKDGFHRYLYRARVLFFSIAYKLTPARRALFASSILALLFSLFDFGLRLGGKEDDWSFKLEYSPFFAAIAVACLVYLIALEMVDKIRVRDELEVARQLQTDLMPKTSPELAGYHFAHSWRTANEVGGDYYDFLPLPDGRLVLVVGDASGHGMASGLVMAIAHATLKTALDLDPSCESVVKLMNRAICRTGDKRTFMSLFYGLLDPETGRLEHTSAGHPFPLLRRADGSVLELGRGGLPLGLVDPLPVVTDSVVFAPGDTLVLYSDGLPEAVDQAGNAYGYERLKQHTAAGGSPQALHSRILNDFDRHTAGSPLRDDLTLVVVEHTPPPSTDLFTPSPRG